MTADKLIGNLLANQARLATWGFIFGGGGGVQIFAFFGKKSLEKLGSFGFFFSSATSPKISKIKLN
jgi:hypothetical protein